jgi:hypothetical protein
VNSVRRDAFADSEEAGGKLSTPIRSQAGQQVGKPCSGPKRAGISERAPRKFLPRFLT